MKTSKTINFSSYSHLKFKVGQRVSFKNLPLEVNGVKNPLVGKTGIVKHSQHNDVDVIVEDYGMVGFLPENLVSETRNYKISKGTFTIGDKYSSDFDMDAMFDLAEVVSLDWTTKDLKSLFSSLEDMNCHREAKLLQGIIDEKSNKSLRLFKELLAEEEDTSYLVQFPDDILDAEGLAEKRRHQKLIEESEKEIEEVIEPIETTLKVYQSKVKEYKEFMSIVRVFDFNFGPDSEEPNENDLEMYRIAKKAKDLIEEIYFNRVQKVNVKFYIGHRSYYHEVDKVGKSYFYNKTKMTKSSGYNSISEIPEITDRMKKDMDSDSHYY